MSWMFRYYNSRTGGLAQSDRLRRKPENLERETSSQRVDRTDECSARACYLQDVQPLDYTPPAPAVLGSMRA